MVHVETHGISLPQKHTQRGTSKAWCECDEPVTAVGSGAGERQRGAATTAAAPRTATRKASTKVSQKRRATLTGSKTDHDESK